MSTSLSPESTISAISMYSGIDINLLDENRNCRDLNAETLNQGGEIVCRCIDTYVSSNGGKIQGALDSCVPCFSSSNCAFEGDKCILDDECVWNSCIDGRCAELWVSNLMHKLRLRLFSQQYHAKTIFLKTRKKASSPLDDRQHFKRQ